MKPYHFAALVALMGVSFLAGGLATLLARRSVEGWYRSSSRPQQVPPPPAYGWGWTGVLVLMGAAAWLVWLTAPHWAAPWILPGMVLYFVMLGLHVAWSGTFFRMDRPGAAMGILVLLWLVTLATLAVFWQVDTLGGALLIPLLLWTGYLGWRNLKWWRHGRHVGDTLPQPTASPSQQAA
ncbi:MAG TPA: TspO/MBR family protein [Terriglobales bacterium]|nr:TspO/MBR family protein [Terriglobales bacterium]